jgi:hypothetical protein
LYSVSQSDKATNPYATVAMAGHTTAGTWCECGSPGCICDPGEQPIGQSARPMSDGRKDLIKERRDDLKAIPIRRRVHV